MPSCGAFNILRHLSLSSIRFVANASIPHLQFYSGQWSGSQTSGLALAGCKSVSPDCTLTQSQSTADLSAFSNQKSEAGACSNKISHLPMNRTSSFQSYRNSASELCMYCVYGRYHVMVLVVGKGRGWDGT